MTLGLFVFLMAGVTVAGGPDSSRPPMRSSSMGSLSSGLKPTAQHNGRRPRQEVYNGWFDGALPQISHHPNGTSVSARQRSADHCCM